MIADSSARERGVARKKVRIRGRARRHFLPETYDLAHPLELTEQKYESGSRLGEGVATAQFLLTDADRLICGPE